MEEEVDEGVALENMGEEKREADGFKKKWWEKGWRERGWCEGQGGEAITHVGEDYKLVSKEIIADAKAEKDLGQMIACVSELYPNIVYACKRKCQGARKRVNPRLEPDGWQLPDPKWEWAA